MEQRTTRMQEVNKGNSLCEGDIQEPSVFSAQFFCKLHTAPNIKKITRTKSGELEVTFTPPGKLT